MGISLFQSSIIDKTRTRTGCWLFLKSGNNIHVMPSIITVVTFQEECFIKIDFSFLLLFYDIEIVYMFVNMKDRTWNGSTSKL
jgi:hypothetical protein